MEASAARELSSTHILPGYGLCASSAVLHYKCCLHLVLTGILLLAFYRPVSYLHLQMYYMQYISLATYLSVNGSSIIDVGPLPESA